jgi:hypothetical protein
MDDRDLSFSKSEDEQSEMSNHDYEQDIKPVSLETMVFRQRWFPYPPYRKISGRVTGIKIDPQSQGFSVLVDINYARINSIKSYIVAVR